MGVAVGKYHLFKRSRKSGTFFYYWYQENNRRLIKTCGRACTSKRDSVAFLENLLKQELDSGKKQTVVKSMVLEDFAGGMFIEGAPHLARWAAKGKVLKRQTVMQHRRHLIKYILPLLSY